jgi:hypothetical protein
MTKAVSSDVSNSAIDIRNAHYHHKLVGKVGSISNRTRT